MNINGPSSAPIFAQNLECARNFLRIPQGSDYELAIAVPYYTALSVIDACVIR
jgi:hypothetical protein